jgi:hypothetical protein
MADLTLSSDELHALTGYRMPSRQLARLHALGYWQAVRSPAGGVTLTRVHFEAVARGETGRQPERPRVRQVTPTLRAA